MSDILDSLSNKASPLDAGCPGFDTGRHVEGLICLSVAPYIQTKLLTEGSHHCITRDQGHIWHLRCVFFLKDTAVFGITQVGECW